VGVDGVPAIIAGLVGTIEEVNLADRVSNGGYTPRGREVAFDLDRECFCYRLDDAEGWVKLKKRKSNLTSSVFWMMKIANTPTPVSVAIAPPPSLLELLLVLPGPSSSTTLPYRRR
jgi:hypothetical protein